VLPVAQLGRALRHVVVLDLDARLGRDSPLALPLDFAVSATAIRQPRERLKMVR
jgi:hypothetical protein